MNLQEIRELQEAYLDVYQLDEVLDTPEASHSYAKKCFLQH
jgi:hypothetical protein